MYINLDKYKPVAVTVKGLADNKVTLGVSSPMASYVTVLIMQDGIPTNHYTTDSPIQVGDITINFVESTAFNVFAFTAKDRVSNYELGRTKFGMFFPRINPMHLTPFNTTERKVPDGGMLLIIPSQDTEEIQMQYHKITNSTTEIGEVTIS